MSWSTSSRASRLPSDWLQITRKILRRDKFKCQLNFLGCKRKANQVDHKIPGDDHRDENLQAVCDKCHAQKSSQEGNQAQAKYKSMRRRPVERHPGLK